MFGEEIKTLLKYTGPIFGTHISEYALVIIPVICVGRDSTTGLAAITLASMFAMITGFSIVKGFISSLDTVLPSTWTSSHPELAALWTQRIGIPILILWFNAEPILSLLRLDPQVTHLASLYLRWISLGLPAYSFNFISRRYYKSQGQFSVPTKITFIVALLNAFLTYLLVLAPTPLKIGFVGAPIATALSFNVISVLFLIHGARVEPRRAWQPISWAIFKNLGILFQLGLCGVGQIGLRLWAWELVTLASSFLGPVSLASQSILVISAATVFRAPFSLGIATSVRIGNLLGQRDAERAEIAARAALSLVVAIILVMIFARLWARLFNHDPEIITTVAKIMPLISLFQIFHGTSAVTGAIARARGKQITGALVNLGAYYIMGFPIGIYLAFSLDYGLYGLWIGMTLSLVYCASIGLYLCLRVDWNSEVQKVMKRLQMVNAVREIGAYGEQWRVTIPAAKKLPPVPSHLSSYRYPPQATADPPTSNPRTARSSVITF
ncbi:hypothetical protein M413DRAFT_20353 [Hebeloma cylindrosporum]|uniref:Polysaccharide biosynthesis protein C-terminal domain-containing protein n=1 Tax=Hebeloma cylindrosporum TaxID=76867 RepID=A0A0C2XH07_HEBCY|nr:hypothetical protein M413DRAFT_20353 [Hebeloma cylindrosporum h7]